MMPSPLARVRRRAFGLVGAGLVVALLIGLGGLATNGPFERANRWLFDELSVRFASGERAADTVVVDIDDVSLTALGQWPWPRYRLAQLIQLVAAQQPAAIALDILLPEADRVSLDNVRQAFKRDFGLDLEFSGVPVGLQDNDGFLGQTIAQVGVVGARYFYFDRTTPEAAPPRPGVGFIGAVDALQVQRAMGVLDNIPSITDQTRRSGFVNSHIDADGLLRRLPVLIEYRGVVHASLALAATLQALQLSAAELKVDGSGVFIELGTHRLPLDSRGRALLRFNGAAERYPELSALDVLNGKVATTDLRGKIVFIGSSAVGLNDHHATAVDPYFSGPKLQAVLAQNILDDALLQVPAWANQVNVALCLALGLLLGISFATVRGMAPLVIVSVVASTGLLALCLALFAYAGVFLPIMAPLVVCAVLVALAFGDRFAMQQRRARRWRKQLENARQVTMESMAAVAETRDPETGAHIKRTQYYVRAIAERLQRTGHYPETLTRRYIDLLFLSAPLHDIGKVGVPDHILLKPGRLTEAEMAIMRQHAEFGRRIILSSASHIEGDNFLALASEVAVTHHERWDGNGYPHGLAGQAIPLSGRIMTVADIYDALISRRCYKEPFSHEHSLELMRELNGKAFDPVVLAAFLAIEADIQAIAQRFLDEERVLVTLV